jgi:hypothetical protein
MRARCPRSFPSLFATLAGALAATAAAAQGDDCLISTDAIRQPVPRFADYPASVETIRHPAAPVLASREARMFRTELREGARKGPNFAGHFTVVGWGCGSACIQWAVVDARTGKVRLEPSIEVVSVDNVADANADVFALRFRRDSRLMIILGAPKEDQAREGAAFYEWTGERFRLLKFAPRKAACMAGAYGASSSGAEAAARSRALDSWLPTR